MKDKIKSVIGGVLSVVCRSSLLYRPEPRPEHDEEIRMNKAEQMQALKKLAQEMGDEETQAYATRREQALKRLSEEYDILRNRKLKED